MRNVLVGLAVVMMFGCGDDGGRAHADATVAVPIDAALDAAVPCALTACGNACVDLMTNIDHCGACGHECGCGSLTCTAGVCDSYDLAPGQNAPDTIALDDGNLYWGNDALPAGVSRLDLQTGSEGVQYVGLTVTRGIAFDATNIYITRFNFNVMEYGPLAGSNVQNLTESQEAGADGLVTDATAAYWTDYSTGFIRTAPLGGSPLTSGTTLLSGQTHPDLIAADADNLYWTTNTVGGTVMKMPKTGGTAVPLATGLANPHAIAVDDTYVYWTETGNGSANTGSVNRVHSDPTAGSDVTVYAAAQPGPSIVAIDAHFVYWTDTAAGTVMRAPIDGTGSPTPIAVGENEPIGLVVTPTCLYFADYGGGTAGSGSIRSHDID